MLLSALKRIIKPFYHRFQRTRIYNRLNLILNFIYDLRRFWKWSSSNPDRPDRNRLKSLIIMDYHRIEKGLSFAKPRPNFGVDAVNRLINNLIIYEKMCGDEEVVQIALDSLSAYFEFQRRQGFENKTMFSQYLSLKNKQSGGSSKDPRGGVIKISKNEIIGSAKIDLSDFFSRRHSIRNFDSADVSLELIESAVRMAMKTPSVCNRQSWKVYVFSDPAEKSKILALQNGNAGFSEEINKVLIVTSELGSFVSTGERNQCWIDGGMFAMSLIYGLHSMGLGTCCLNWSVEASVDKKMKRLTGIPDSEVIIMLLACGHLPDSIHVAKSTRKSVEETMIVRIKKAHGNNIGHEPKNTHE